MSNQCWQCPIGGRCRFCAALDRKDEGITTLRADLACVTEERDALRASAADPNITGWCNVCGHPLRGAPCAACRGRCSTITKQDHALCAAESALARMEAERDAAIALAEMKMADMRADAERIRLPAEAVNTIREELTSLSYYPENPWHARFARALAALDAAYPEEA